MIRPRSLQLLLVLTLFGAACGEVVEPEGFSIAVETSVAGPESGASSVESPEEAVVSTTPVTSNFVPSRPDDYLPEVLISTSQAVLSAGPTGVRVLDGNLAGLDTTRAVDDLLGGLVIQRADEGGEVVWLSAQGEEPAVLDVEGALLLDVGYIEGSPSAVVLIDDGQIDQIRLVDNVRTSLVVLSDDEQVLALSASGALHAVAIANERCGELRFYAADGSMIDLNGPGEPECIVPRRPVYGAVALSPDGGALVYTVVSYRDDGIEVATELVARELSTGSDYFRRKIGQDGERITALSFDGNRVAFLRQSVDDASVALLDVAAGNEPETPIDLLGATLVDSVSFTRLPLAEG